VTDQLRSGLPSHVSLKVFGNDNSQLWGLTLYWDPDTAEVVAEAALLSVGLPVWGPEQSR